MRTLTAILLFLLLLPCSPHAADKVVVIATGEWAPFTGRELPHNGFVNHLVKEAYAREGYTVRFEFFPWKRVSALVKHGEVDAGSYWYKNQNQAPFSTFSDPVSIEKVMLFHLKGKPIGKWNELTDLRNYRIGIMNGITYTDELKSLYQMGALKVFPSNTNEENIEKLIRGRIDIFPSALEMTKETLMRYFTPAERAVITYNAKPLMVAKGHVTFPKKSPRSEELRKALNAGLKKLRADGTYRRLEKKLQNGGYSVFATTQ